MVALTAALGAVLLEATYGADLATTPEQTFLLSPLMIAPFAGYGLAGGIAVVAVGRARR